GPDRHPGDLRQRRGVLDREQRGLGGALRGIEVDLEIRKEQRGRRQQRDIAAVVVVRRGRAQPRRRRSSGGERRGRGGGRGEERGEKQRREAHDRVLLRSAHGVTFGAGAICALSPGAGVQPFPRAIASMSTANRPSADMLVTTHAWLWRVPGYVVVPGPPK